MWSSDRITSEVGGVRLRIPREYFTYSHQTKPLPQLQAILPNLRANWEDNPNCRSNKTNWHDIVFLSLSSQAYPSPEQQLKNLIKNNADIVESRNDLTLHKNTIISKNADTYSYLSDDGRLRILVCVGVGQHADFENCETWYKNKEGIQVYYSFNWRHLNEWVDIDRKIENLIERFIEKPGSD